MRVLILLTITVLMLAVIVALRPEPLPPLGEVTEYGNQRLAEDLRSRGQLLVEDETNFIAIIPINKLTTQTVMLR